MPITIKSHPRPWSLNDSIFRTADGHAFYVGTENEMLSKDIIQCVNAMGDVKVAGDDAGAVADLVWAARWFASGERLTRYYGNSEETLRAESEQAANEIRAKAILSRFILPTDNEW